MIIRRPRSRATLPVDLELDKCEFRATGAAGPGRAATVAALMRQAADRLDELGDAQIAEITLLLEPDGAEDRLRLSTLYRSA